MKFKPNNFLIVLDDHYGQFVIFDITKNHDVWKLLKGDTDFGLRPFMESLTRVFKFGVSKLRVETVETKLSEEQLAKLLNNSSNLMETIAELQKNAI